MRSSYIDILNNKVEIPIIQRDYAQGRTSQKVNKIRKDFLDVLFDFIATKEHDNEIEIELDFIYGFNEKNDNQVKFIPIDGQQRLTTLWLIYWFVSAKEKVLESEKEFLLNFLYETRHSTTQFCKRLIEFEPNFSHNHIDEEIKNQSWYFETWHYDPSVQAMFVVLKDIEERYKKLNINHVWDIIKSSPFYFYKLDMDNVGLSDDLYIKMNSRGKPLTEFEYFKAFFSDVISDSMLRVRFEESIDGEWINTIWNIISQSDKLEEDADIALIVDSSFLNLFNFITSVISFKKDLKGDDGLRYSNTVESANLLSIIYKEVENQNFLFDTLDAITQQARNNPTFWNDIFYYKKEDFNINKTRLYFQGEEKNLLNRCLRFADDRALTFPEQILLLACFTHFKTPSQLFNRQIRIIRNLVTNSENELRESILGNSFTEIEEFIRSNDLKVLKSFNTDQIEEEIIKHKYLSINEVDLDILLKFEDSSIFRGSVSLLPLDNKFIYRAKKFLTLFDEEEIVSHFNQKTNLLLSFGDYSQVERSGLRNLMTDKPRIIRRFLTRPGYSKEHFINKTQCVIVECLDFFINNPVASVGEQIKEDINSYINNPKDWIYYFMMYPSFRANSNQGYYYFHNNENYCIWAMKERQFNGQHWDPFLREVLSSKISNNISLENYGDKMIVSHNSDVFLISSIREGFLFEYNTESSVNSKTLEYLKSLKILDENNILRVPQTNDKLDTVDRIELLKNTIIKIEEDLKQERHFVC